MDTKQHEWGFDGRARHSVRAGHLPGNNGAHGVARPTKLEFNSESLVFIPSLEN
jgi:hypothetical protein